MCRYVVLVNLCCYMCECGVLLDTTECRMDSTNCGLAFSLIIQSEDGDEMQSSI